MLASKEREFLEASEAVEEALALRQSGVPELERLQQIAAELAELAQSVSNRIHLELNSFLE